MLILFIILMFKQYSNNQHTNNKLKNQKFNNKIQYNSFVRNWSLTKFNSLPLVQRITMINQANRIIQAYRNYSKTKGVS